MPTKKHKTEPALPKAYVDLRCHYNESSFTIPSLACGAGLIESAEILCLRLFGALEGVELDTQSADLAAEAGSRDDDGQDSLELAEPYGEVALTGEDN